MMRKVFLMLGLSLLADSTAWAIPQTLNFQGYLKEANVPVNGLRNMTFGIYNAPTGGSPLFSVETYNGANQVNVSTGVFSVMLGSLTSGGIPLSVFDGNDKYVEVVVGATTLPRQMINSVGNAFFAATAANLAPGAQISSTVTFTANGADYSIRTTSGISVQNGGVTAPFFSGTFVGNGAGLTGLTGDSNKVAKAGDTMTGSLTMSGASANIVSGASVTAGGFFGNSAQFGSGATKSTFTSSGNLLLSGSMSASSATLSATGGSIYSLTTSSGIHILAGGIKWADGSVSTTAPSAPAVPTRQVLTSGSAATYTTPTGARQLRIRMVGGGGGAGGSGGSATNGSNGTATIFNSIYANPGQGSSLANGGGTGNGGAGGSGGSGTASFRMAGNPGAQGTYNVAVCGVGGASVFGGAGGCSWVGSGNAATANSGSGGGGADRNNSTGGTGGGGAGEYVELIINSPGASYTYTIGGGGASGTATSPDVSGGAGATGIIIVDEFY